MRYNLRNTAGQYFCSTRDSLAYEWVSADALAARGYDGLVIYTEKRHAEQDILQALSPKTVKVGNRAMVRPDFPDMTPCTRHDQCLTDFCKPEVMQCNPRDTTPPEPCCLFGFTRLGDYCYELQLRNADYDGSRAYCQAQFSGDLSTVPSQEVNDLIVQLLDTANVTSAWVGISDRQTEGVFVDVTGAQQQFSQWGTGRPRNNGQRNCVEVAGDGYSETGDNFSPGEWNDLICEKQRSSVCRTGVLPICPKLRR